MNREGSDARHSIAAATHGGGADGGTSGTSLDNLVDSAQAILEAREELDQLKAAVEAARDEVGSSIVYYLYLSLHRSGLGIAGMFRCFRCSMLISSFSFLIDRPG